MVLQEVAVLGSLIGSGKDEKKFATFHVMERQSKENKKRKEKKTKERLELKKKT